MIYLIEEDLQDGSAAWRCPVATVAYIALPSPSTDG